MFLRMCFHIYFGKFKEIFCLYHIVFKKLCSWIWVPCLCKCLNILPTAPHSKANQHKRSFGLWHCRLDRNLRHIVIWNATRYIYDCGQSQLVKIYASEQTTPSFTIVNLNSIIGITNCTFLQLSKTPNPRLSNPLWESLSVLSINVFNYNLWKLSLHGIRYCLPPQAWSLASLGHTACVPWTKRMTQSGAVSSPLIKSGNDNHVISH